MSDREATGTGVVMNGRVEWDDARGFTQDLKALGTGPVIVTVERASRRALRGLQVNKYLWSHVYTLMAAESGISKDDLHDLMVAKFLRRAITIVNRQTGEIETQQAARRSSRLSPDDFWDFVMQVRLFGSEFYGITFKEPDKRWRERDREVAA